MIETVTYVGVKCKTRDCRNLIGLKSLTMVEGRTLELPLLLWPMRIRCSRCEQINQYAKGDLVEFAGPSGSL